VERSKTRVGHGDFNSKSLPRRNTFPLNAREGVTPFQLNARVLWPSKPLPVRCRMANSKTEERGDLKTFRTIPERFPEPERIDHVKSLMAVNNRRAGP